MDESKGKVWQSVEKLDDWLEKNGWVGWDPYDLKGLGWYIGLSRKKNLLSKMALRTLSVLESFFPVLTRKILGVKPSLNSKTVGLFLKAYLNFYRSTSNHVYLEKAKKCANWLLNNPSKGYSGICWGYPFDWESIVSIPKYTPSSVVTTAVGDGFYSLYKITGDKIYIDICVSICNFLINNLNITFEDKGKKVVCFSYTPLDNYQVHNANLFTAEYLSRIGKEIGNEAFIEKSISAGRFALLEQNKDGSIYYWGKEQNHYSPYHLDVYHSGFEIRCLYGMWKHTGLKEFQIGYKNYLGFYIKNFFTKDGIPRLTPDSLYPIDIHGCAEAINCLALVSKEDEKTLDLALKVAKWTIENMQTDEGWFVYRILKAPFGLKRVRISYIRWGQAWMMKGLSELICL